MREPRRPFFRQLYYGWFVLAAVAGINYANGATAIGVLTVFILPFTDEFNWTRTQISAVTSVGAILGATLAPFIGRLTDRIGARLPLTLGGICIVLAAISLANIQTLLGFYLAFGLARLADQGLVQTSSPTVIAKWFQRYRGRAMATLFFASSLGGVTLPLLVQTVITSWNWRLAWLVLAGIMLVVGLIPCALWIRRQPEDYNWEVDGTKSAEASDTAATTSEPIRPLAARDSKVSWQLHEARQTPTLWFFLGAAFILGIANTGVALHLVPYLVQQNITPMRAVGAVSIGFLATGVGNLLWGYGADRYTIHWLLVIAYVLRTASLAVLLMTDSITMAYGFAILRGFSDGGIGTLTTVLLAEYYGRQHFGAIYGLLRAVQVVGFALGPLVSGLVFDVTRSYDGAFQAFLGLSLVGTVLVILAKAPTSNSHENRGGSQPMRKPH